MDSRKFMVSSRNLLSEAELYFSVPQTTVLARNHRFVGGTHFPRAWTLGFRPTVPRLRHVLCNGPFRLIGLPISCAHSLTTFLVSLK